MPVTIRLPYGGGIGAVEHHSESPEAYFAHTAGLRVVTPSNPVDAYWMIQEAIASDDPVLFFEPKALYQTACEVPDEMYTIPFGQAAFVREFARGAVGGVADRLHRPGSQRARRSEGRSGATSAMGSSVAIARARALTERNISRSTSMYSARLFW